VAVVLLSSTFLYNIITFMRVCKIRLAENIVLRALYCRDLSISGLRIHVVEVVRLQF